MILEKTWAVRAELSWDSNIHYASEVKFLDQVLSQP